MKSKTKKYNVKAELCKNLSKVDLQELCDATEEAILAGGGFGWISPPSLKTLQDYWKGVLMVPNRWLFLGKYKGVISGSIQVVTVSSSNEAAIFRVFIDTHFVATWARGHGLAKLLLETAQNECVENNFTHVILDVRDTQIRAISLYEQLGFKLWGKLPAYHKLANGQIIPGNFYYKSLKQL